MNTTLLNDSEECRVRRQQRADSRLATVRTSYPYVLIRVASFSNPWILYIRTYQVDGRLVIILLFLLIRSLGMECMAENIQTVSIARETHERYLRLCVSVITSRPCRTCATASSRCSGASCTRCTTTCTCTSTAGRRKCAKIVGDVIGNYHPHGDVAAYDALVRMAQDWVMRVPLVHGQGNFGSVDGDPPAADRYTEAKLTAVADRLLAELRQKTVDMRPNYDNTTQEPVVLPAQFPNLLVNGVAGIAVGMATNIPPHNLGEVLPGLRPPDREPRGDDGPAARQGQGPGLPARRQDRHRPARRCARSTKKAHGSIKVQGEWKLERRPKQKPQIVVTSIPYGVEQGQARRRRSARSSTTRKLPQLTRPDQRDRTRRTACASRSRSSRAPTRTW